MPVTFTLEDALALLPLISRRAGGALQIAAHLKTTERRLTSLGESADPTTAAAAAELAARVRLLTDALRDETVGLERLGVVVRDVSRGVIEFRSVLDGERDVFLCWQLGERTIVAYREAHGPEDARRSIEGHRFFRSRQLAPPRAGS